MYLSVGCEPHSAAPPSALRAIDLRRLQDGAISPAADVDAVAAVLREALARGNGLHFGTEPLRAKEVVATIYAARDFAPLWTTSGGLTEHGMAVAEAISTAVDEGLDPRRYYPQTLGRIFAELANDLTTGPGNVEHWAEIDLILTDAFATMCSDAAAGRVDPESAHAMWMSVRRRVDVHKFLSEFLRAAPAGSPVQLAAPLHPGYVRLRQALRTMRAFSADTWTQIPAGPLVRPGDADPRIPAIRARLQRLGDAGDADPGGITLDASLTNALRRFQSRHGLPASGRIDADTLAALNVAPAQRLRQIELNLERWRWLPADLGQRFLLLNIAGFWLRAIESGQTRWEARVMVGRNYRQTPVMTGTMRAVVFNPSWTVPETILLEDKLPEIRRDPTVLIREGFHLLRGNQEISPLDVDWAAVSAHAFPYRIVQSPGVDNPLGQVKFVFPNRYAVYLHDTPARSLFDSPQRDFTSGCIRVEKPLELAELLLNGYRGWNRARIEKTIASGRETVVPVRDSWPIHLVYFTSWVEPDGTLHFRDDVYGRDAQLAAALAAQTAEIP